MILLFVSTLCFGAKLNLTQEKTIEMVLRSLKSQELAAQYEQTKLPLAEVLSPFDWKLKLSSGLEQDRAETLSSPSSYDFERQLTNLSLNKKFISGTELSFSLSRTLQKAAQIPTGSSLLPQLNSDNAAVEVTQELWNNFLGSADRSRIESSEYLFESLKLKRASDLQVLILEALQLFWKTYVSQEQNKQALAARERYEKLVTSVQRKASLGYARPGESFQVQAELQSRIQAVSFTSQEYLRNLAQLTTLLSVSNQTEIEFEIPKKIAPLPTWNPVTLDELRAVKAQQLKTKSMQADYEVAKSLSQPKFELVLKSSATGVDESSSKSSSEVFEGKNDKSYVGFNFEYQFGSNSVSEKPQAKKAALLQEQTKLSRTTLETKDQLLLLQQKITALHQVALSTEKQKELRGKAMQELTKSYAQGRTDLSTLIDSMNKFFDAEVLAVTSLGNYEISKNEYLAARDELIPKNE
jgi:outer membrane protein TolC